jgi:uncharacterized protein
MSHTYHKLTSQLPEHADKIKILKEKDPHFAKLAERYSRNNLKIKAFENGVKATSDFHMEELKKKRLFLLDIINHILMKTDEQDNQAA